MLPTPCRILIRPAVATMLLLWLYASIARLSIFASAPCMAEAYVASFWAVMRTRAQRCGRAGLRKRSPLTRVGPSAATGYPKVFVEAAGLLRLTNRLRADEVAPVAMCQAG